MGRLLESLLTTVFGKPQQLSFSETSPRTERIVRLLAEHKATIATRVPVNQYMWQRWARDLAAAILESLDELAQSATSAREHPNPRIEFQARLIELADEFDHLDHQTSEDGMGTELQNECMRVRELARSLRKSMDVPVGQ